MNHGVETVKVYFEKPVEGGFYSATCYLPHYKWENIEGFSPVVIEDLQNFVQSTAHIIIQLAREARSRGRIVI